MASYSYDDIYRIVASIPRGRVATRSVGNRRRHNRGLYGPDRRLYSAALAPAGYVGLAEKLARRI